jgi:hypothetical protein
MNLQFPVDAKTKKPSSILFGTNILSRALASVNPTAPEVTEILNDKNFRNSTYKNYILKTLEEGAKSTENCMKIARGGLAYMYESIQVVQKDGTRTPLKNVTEIINGNNKLVLKTKIIKGIGHKKKSFQVPYGKLMLEKSGLVEQVKKWEKLGVIEPTAADSFNNFLRNEVKYIENLRKHLFVVMGAGAAMGPFKILLDLGLNVVAVDLNRPNIWERLIKYAQNSPGQLFLPCRENDDGSFGANLISEFPAIALWLANLEPSYNMTVGNYAYVDGGMFVKIACAQDFISQYVYKNRRQSNTSLAYLCSPTDAFLWPKAAVDASMHGYNNRGIFAKLSNTASLDRFCKSNVEQMPDPVNGNYIIECFVTQQGPNYAIAKRIQHWRALVAKEDDNIAVSTNIAPSSSTKSVTSNSLLAAAYEGTEYFPPIEIFSPETSNHVMTAMLLNDICDVNSVAYPNQKPLSNPLYLFSDGSWHGGFWRSPFQLSSLVELSAVLGLGERYLNYVALAIGAAFIVIRHGRGRSRL